MDHDSSSLRIPVAMGELIDRLTILAIKEDKITDPIKVNHILAEKCDLTTTLNPALANLPVDIQRSIEPLMVALLTINASLWEVEESLRRSEHARVFDARFVWMARCVYLLNDSRAAMKRSISLAAGSQIFEEKSYS